MTEEGRYSAEEAAQILQAENIQVTKRTVNYYAFDKNMFPVTTGGKKCFTDAELDKLRAICLLKEHTNFTLEQIKKLINSRSLEEIQDMCAERASSIKSSKTNTSNSNFFGESIPQYLFSPMVSEVRRERETPDTRTIKISDDITLVVGPNVSREKLRQIINLLRNLD